MAERAGFLLTSPNHRSQSTWCHSVCGAAVNVCTLMSFSKCGSHHRLHSAVPQIRPAWSSHWQSVKGEKVVSERGMLQVFSRKARGALKAWPSFSTDALTNTKCPPRARGLQGEEGVNVVVISPFDEATVG